MKIRHAFLIQLGAWLTALPLKLLSRTLRYHTCCAVPGINPAEHDCPRRYIYALWHDVILVPISIRQRIRRFTEANSVAALVSQHQDGSYLVGMMKQFRIDSVRGSTTRGGVQALRQLLVQAGRKHVFITPDGPRGPRRQLKDGILFLASQTGIPIIPTGFACSRAWRIQGSWTDQLVPKPGAHCYLVLGAPFAVPSDISREELAAFRERLQAELERLERVAEDWSAGIEPQLGTAPAVESQAA